MSIELISCLLYVVLIVCGFLYARKHRLAETSKNVMYVIVAMLTVMMVWCGAVSAINMYIVPVETSYDTQLHEYFKNHEFYNLLGYWFTGKDLTQNDFSQLDGLLATVHRYGLYSLIFVTAAYLLSMWGFVKRRLGRYFLDCIFAIAWLLAIWMEKLFDSVMTEIVNASTTGTVMGFVFGESHSNTSWTISDIILPAIFLFIYHRYLGRYYGVVNDVHPSDNPVQSVSVGQTKRCPYCGEEILAVAKKCKHCGEWLPEEHKRQIRCSACGELVDEGVEVCPHCNEKIVNAEPPKDNVAAEASGGQNPAAKNYISLIIIALSLVFTVFIVVYACNEKINNGDEPQQTTETVDSAAVDDDDSMAADTAVVDPATDDVENDEAVPADDQSTGQQGSSESESNGNYDDFTIK